MFDQESDDFFNEMVSDPEYNSEELLVIKRLDWEYKALGMTTKTIVRRIQLLVRAVQILTLLMANRGVYAVREILSYLTPKEFILLAAASHNLIMEFFTVESSIAKKIFSGLSKEYQKYGLIPNLKYLCSLPTGQLLKKELLIFKVLSSRHYVIDDFALIPQSKYLNVVFNPRYPILALSQYNSLYIIAYSGSIRQTAGQILFFVKHYKPQYIKWFSWNSTGSYLLMASNEYTNKNCKGQLVSFSVCMYIS